MLAEYDAEIAALERDVAALQDGQRKLQELFSDPVERSRRRHALRRAVADWFESAPQSDEFFAALAAHLPSEHRWLTDKRGRAHLGWVEQHGRWRLDAEDAPDLEAAFAAPFDGG